MPPRLPELIKRARRLAHERDGLVQELAREWSAALRGQGFSPRDLDELWAGLTEDAVRRLLRTRREGASPEAIRREATKSSRGSRSAWRPSLPPADEGGGTSAAARAMLRTLPSVDALLA